uniref:Uncharacterized protein n=1 Tax=Rhizophora mucronata TaxID=61149 RepID=A0A2P2M8W7_RHIMU
MPWDLSNALILPPSFRGQYHKGQLLLTRYSLS